MIRKALALSKAIRILARVDVKNDTVIKGINLEGLRVVGSPEDMSLKYYRDGIDGFIFMDPVASLYGRNHLTELVKKTAKSLFVPMTVGGGVRSLKDVESLLMSGADKVAINTQAIKKPNLISDVANRFGSQCMVLSIEAKNKGDGSWEAYYDNGREPSGLSVIDWAKRAEDLGAGEIMLTSIDKEGTRQGFETDLIKKVNESVTIPVIVSGGYGNPNHILSALESTNVSGFAIADAFHYDRISPSQLKNELNMQGVLIRARGI